MRVARILQSKGHSLITASPDTFVSDIANTLTKERVGVVVVTASAGAIVGILSERDIVRGLTEHAAGLLDLRAKDLMTTTVITCEAETSLDDVMELMSANHIRHLPVIEDDRLTGVISIVDVVRALLARAELNQEVIRAAG